MEEIIKSIIRTLDTIRVTGEDDMSKMLGCIYALKSLTRPATEAEEVKE